MIYAQAVVADYLQGHAAVESGRFGGLVPHRLPAAARAQSDDEFFHWVEACPAGVSLRFLTDATEIDVKLALTAIRMYGRETLIPRLAVRDAGVTTVLEAERYSVLIEDEHGESELDEEDPTTVRIRRSGEMGEVELMLPHRAHAELISLKADTPLLPTERGKRPLWVHYGSSISHCFESESPDLTWPAQVAQARDWELRNLSLAGHAQLDQFAARVISAQPADLITLKLGINIVAGDTMRERTFQSAVHGFLDTIREGRPNTPIVLYSPISCPIVEDAPGPVFFKGDRFYRAKRELEHDDGALTLAHARAIVADAVSRRTAADSQLHHVDGRELFGPDDVALLEDDLHPNQAGYNLIASRFSGTLPPALQG